MNAPSRVARWPIWAMLWKEFVQMRRDRLTLGLMVAVPAMQLVLFGFAVRTEVEDLPTLVLDRSRTSESRALVATLENTGSFRVVGAVEGRDELRRRIARGEAGAGIVVPPEFATDLKRGRGARAQVVVDAADPLSSSAALSGAALAASAGAERRGPPALEVRVRPWYNPGLRSEVFVVPGLVGVLLTLTCVLVTSLAITRERERGTLEQLVVTPVGKASLILGKILPFVAVAYVQMALVLLLGWLVFGVPVRGSLGLLAAVTLLFLLASLGLGLLVSTVARTQAQAMQLAFMLILPHILLSGFLFPVAAMPRPIRWLSAALPLTHYLRALRGVLLRGADAAAVLPQAAVLAAMAAAIVAVSVRRFSKTIE